MACHRYRLNLTGFLVATWLRRLIFLSFELKTTFLILCLHWIDEVTVSELVYRSLAQNVS